MSEPIGPRDWVERDPTYSAPPEIPREAVSVHGEWPRIGPLYQVREVGFYRSLGGRREAGLRLVGIVASIPGHPDAWWPAAGFRPIYRPKGKQLIRDLLEPVKEDA